MKAIPKLVASLTALLILTGSFPAFAVDTENPQKPENTPTIQDGDLTPGTSGDPTKPSPSDPSQQSARPHSLQKEAPQFSVALITDCENPGIYGTLSNIPEGTTAIYLSYSLGGINFDFFDDFTWDLGDPSEGAPSLTQLCLKADEHPLTAYLRQEVNSIYIRLHFSLEENFIETEAVKISHNKTYPLPETPPPFTATVELDSMGYYCLKGRFLDFLPNVARVRTMYSLDGTSFQAADETFPHDWHLNARGTEDPERLDDLQNQTLSLAYNEPLKSYLTNKLDRFYCRLEITTEDGQTYNSQAAVMERGVLQPLPESKTVRATFPFTMRIPDGEEPSLDSYGQYQITVREDASPAEVAALLPDMLPIEVQLFQKDTKKCLAWGRVTCPVSWKELPPLTLKAGESQIIADAAADLVVPAGTPVETPVGIYTLPTHLSFKKRDAVRLIINVVANDEKPKVALKIKEQYSTDGEFRQLFSLAFQQKPSGATSIKVYSSLNEADGWTEICDLLAKRDVDHNQSAKLYGYVDLLQPEESPFSNYLKNEIPGFSIGLEIKGGTFDGERLLLPWPGAYNPPEEIFEPDSSEGTPGNVDWDWDEEEEESAENGGQRPNLPEIESGGKDDADFQISTESPKLMERDSNRSDDERRTEPSDLSKSTASKLKEKAPSLVKNKSAERDSTDSEDNIASPKLPEEEVLTESAPDHAPIVTAKAATIPPESTDTTDKLADLPNLAAQGEPEHPDVPSTPPASEPEAKPTLATTVVSPPPERGMMKQATLAVALLTGGGVIAAVVSTAMGISPIAWFSKVIGVLKGLLHR